MTKINFALIGSGYISNYHARGILAHSDGEIKVVCSADKEQMAEFAAQYKIPETTTEVSELFGRPDIDAAILSIPNKFHAPYAIEFMKNGKDVLIEKPLAMNPTEGEEITRVAKETGQMVLVGHMWRFDNEVNYIKQIIDSGRIGKVIKTNGYGIHENWGPEGWFAKKEMAGGGALADMGVHAIDTVSFLLGNPKPVEVYAKIGTYLGNYDVDDTGIILITWETGVTSVIESGWWQPHSEGPEAATRIYGSAGYASVFPTRIKLNSGEMVGEFIPQMPERAEHCDQVIYNRQIEHFIKCIQKRQQPVPGIKEGMNVLKIVDAAYQSAKTSKSVKLA